jgi:hypothetical protein
MSIERDTSKLPYFIRNTVSIQPGAACTKLYWFKGVVTSNIYCLRPRENVLDRGAQLWRAEGAGASSKRVSAQLSLVRLRVTEPLLSTDT